MLSTQYPHSPLPPAIPSIRISEVPQRRSTTLHVSSGGHASKQVQNKVTNPLACKDSGLSVPNATPSHPKSSPTYKDTRETLSCIPQVKELVSLIYDKLKEIALSSADFIKWNDPSGRHSDIPLVGGSPSLLFHRLGSNNIFRHEGEPGFLNSFQRDITVIPLANSGRTGKTRKILDALTRSFGFYFTCSPGGIGSRDLQAALKIVDGSRKPPVEHCDTEDVFISLCYARYVIFLEFVRALYDLGLSWKPEIPKIWLLLQLEPSRLFGFDAFDDLFHLLLAFPSRSLVLIINANCEANGYIEALNNPGRNPHPAKSWESQAFHFVIDDAGHVLKVKDGYATSDLLREFAYVIALFWDIKTRVMVAGRCPDGYLTKRPAPLRGVNLRSGDGRFHHDLGCFSSKEWMLSFIQSYLWPGVHGQNLPEYAQRLCNRAWDYLKGRYGWTSLLVELALPYNPSNDLNFVLDWLVHRLTGVVLTDNASHVTGLNIAPIVTQDVEAFLKDPTRMDDVVEKLKSLSVNHSHVIGDPQLVALGLARYVDYSSKSYIDEPLVISALALYVTLKRPELKEDLEPLITTPHNYASLLVKS